jgi:hypothetical protein
VRDTPEKKHCRFARISVLTVLTLCRSWREVVDENACGRDIGLGVQSVRALLAGTLRKRATGALLEV